MKFIRNHTCPSKSIVLVLCLFVVIAFHGQAWAPPPPPGTKTYSTSAHGDSTLGVKRTAIELQDYSRGNCSHCHEQHASIDGGEPATVDGSASPFVLFAPTDSSSQTVNFCFNCHRVASSQQSGGWVVNNNYSATFGGGPTVTTTINDAFNPTAGSSHDLSQISTELQASYSGSFTDFSNPCCGCHNPHIAKKNNYTGLTYDPSQAAISPPSDRENLWGDGTDERMDVHAGTNTYRAPFYVGANPAVDPTKHEPDGQTRSISSQEVQGSTTPDYDTFCLDCHARAVGGRLVIVWNSGDANVATRGQHGHGDGTSAGGRKPPYTIDGTSGTVSDTATNFVLSCLDCHEPHGSQATNGEYLLRTTVNGVSGITYAGPGVWWNLCDACHNIPHGAGMSGASCTGCHTHAGKF